MKRMQRNPKAASPGAAADPVDVFEQHVIAALRCRIAQLRRLDRPDVLADPDSNWAELVYSLAAIALAAEVNGHPDDLSEYDSEALRRGEALLRAWTGLRPAQPAIK
jgi:hypothetical protein